MRYLFVVAHPDDEVIGAGGTIAALDKKENDIAVCVLSRWSPTRDDDLREGIQRSHKILGIHKNYVGEFGCMKFKDADHHEMVRFIENSILDCKPDTVITHHPSDIHNDHNITSTCCMEAIRLPQRQICDVPKIRTVAFMEVLSSTNWSINAGMNPFIPNTYSEISEDDVQRKIRSIGIYDNVIRDIPHPRSVESIEALATLRGGESGTRYAEAFQTVFKIGGFR